MIVDVRTHQLVGGIYVRRGPIVDEPDNTAPTATFTSTTNGLVLNVSAAGSADSDGTIVHYGWNFGNGAVASGVTATCTYTAAGTYTVTLSVTDNDGAVTSTARSISVVSDSFVDNQTEPTLANSGAGKIPGRAYPTVVINGNVTLTGTQSLVDRVVTGRVTCSSGHTGLIQNCEVQGGPLLTSGNVWAIQTSSASTTRLEFVTVKIANPSSHINGIGWKNYDAYRCVVLYCNDSFSAFNQPSNGGVNNVKIRCCYMADFVQFRPDAATVRPETHNDHIQLQGGIVDPEDVIITGNAIWANHSTVFGSIPTTATNRAAIMVTPMSASPQPSCSARIQFNWLYGGNNSTINAGGSNNTGILIITDNRFQHSSFITKNTGFFASLNVDSLVQLTAARNTYMHDGSAVIVRNG